MKFYPNQEQDNKFYFYENCTGQLSILLSLSKSEWAFLAQFLIDLVIFFKPQDIESSSI